MKKIVLIILAILVTSTTLAYTINYVLQQEVQHEVTVGNTVKAVDGLIITLLNAEQGNLTYNEIEETSTDKHTLTYEYDYDIIVNGEYNIIVTSLNTDIEILSYTVGTTINVTFQLNQVKEFTQGEVINVHFLFELEELNYNGFTTTNPFNPNTATEEEMIQLGLNSIEIDRTIMQRTLYDLSSLTIWAIKISVAGFEQEYQELVDLGIIIFE